MTMYFDGNGYYIKQFDESNSFFESNKPVKKIDKKKRIKPITKNDKKK